MNYLLIFLGGGAGSVCRYLLSHNINKLAIIGSFPLGVMLVNIIGCLLAGILIGITTKLQYENLIPLLMIGFLGGFTTFSAFSVEALNLLESQKFLYAAIYIIGSVALSLLAALLGFMLSK